MTVRTAVPIAVLGLGEAGSEIARDLVAAGADVRGYDPKGFSVDGVAQRADEADAVAEAAEVEVEEHDRGLRPGHRGQQGAGGAGVVGQLGPAYVVALDGQGQLQGLPEEHVVVDDGDPDAATRAVLLRHRAPLLPAGR